MNKTNILLLTPLDPANIAKIQAVSPEIEVIEAAQWMPPFPPGGDPPDPAKEKELDLRLAAAEVIFGFVFPAGVIQRSPRLKWIQTVSAGVDRALTPEIAASAVTLTNVSGIHAVPISELVFTLMLSFAKNSVRLQHNQSHKIWERTTSATLEGKTLGILGLGHIGRRIASLGQAFGMRVVATRRHVRQMGRARDVERVYPRQQLPALLAECDYVVDCLPSTPETVHLIGEKELRSMKPSAFLINIGRGSTIDEAALIQALREKRIAGAGLDTFQKEPLAPDSPLWEMPNVIVTPHIAGATDDYMTKANAIFCRNLRLYLAGQGLTNVVNKKLGY
jgi:D-2-hydroxyacid dehydrogenase (NADP+)